MANLIKIRSTVWEMAHTVSTFPLRAYFTHFLQIICNNSGVQVARSTYCALWDWNMDHCTKCRGYVAVYAESVKLGRIRGGGGGGGGSGLFETESNLKR
jgi:hypothetical protein